MDQKELEQALRNARREEAGHQTERAIAGGAIVLFICVVIVMLFGVFIARG